MNLLLLVGITSLDNKNFVLDGSIRGYVEPIYFKLSEDIYIVSFVYSINPSDISDNYQIHLRVFKDREKLMEEKKDKKISKSAVYMVDSYEILSKPGKYNIKFEIKSKSRNSRVDFPLEIVEDTYLNFSSLILASKFYEDSLNSPFYRNGIGFLPNPSSIFKDTIFYFFEIYNVKIDSKKISIRFYIQDVKNDSTVLISNQQILLKDKGEFLITGKIPISSIKDGQYKIKFEVVDLGLNIKKLLEKSFEIQREQAIIDDIRYFIDYIASQTELNEFRSIKNKQARELWIDKFWKKKDPDGSFYPIYKQRVIEADMKFSTPFKEGRYTDMGKIYILFGQPDDIRRQEVALGTKSYVIWIYYQNNLRFKFLDQLGTGEYKLMFSNVPGYGHYMEDIKEE
ncbi:MAG: GWxTD domain-containing protein [candidate division WOR-3 bacterium]|nr:GWxTD domain-containing protein [candidate division WOR-3 bacterium]MCX7947093.1 GWxTD domain-containing protein [candidate division WOR-3 bacterium]MDW8149866.1 GWxTD domain-containing protein [candidate division WOR-3 bacterium]